MERVGQLDGEGKVVDPVLLSNSAHSSARLSELELFVGNLDKADKAATEAEALAKRSGDSREQIHCLCRLAAVRHMRGQFDEARKLFEEALDQQKTLEPVKSRVLYSDYGYLHRRFLVERGLTEENRGLQPNQYKPFLEIAENALNYDKDFLPKPIWLIPIGLDQLSKAIAMTRMGEFEHDKWSAAKILFDEALNTLTRSGSVIYLPAYYIALADYHRRRGFTTNAKVAAERARGYASDYGMPLHTVHANLELARNHILDSAYGTARERLDDAEKVINSHKHFRLKDELDRLREKLRQH